MHMCFLSPYLQEDLVFSYNQNIKLLLLLFEWLYCTYLLSKRLEILDVKIPLENALLHGFSGQLYNCGFACGCMLISVWFFLHHVCALAGLLAFHDQLPQNANINENRKMKNILSVTVV